MFRSNYKFYELAKSRTPDSHQMHSLNNLNLRNYFNQLITLNRLHQIFQNNGISWIGMKGLFVASIYYASPLARAPSQDLDILIDKRQIFQIMELLTSEGFTSPFNRIKSHFDLFSRFESEIDVKDPVTSVSIDLHWSLFKPRLKLLALESYETQDILISNLKCRSLEKYYEAIYCALHACKDSWILHKWIVDFALISRSLDRTHLIELAKKHSSLTAVLVSYQLRDILIPGFSNEIKYSARSTFLSRTILFLFRRRRFHNKYNKFICFIYFLLCLDTWKMRMTHLSSVVFPTKRDFTFIIFNSSNSWLYYFLHPIRSLFN
jgi:hypothetical protein